MKKCLAIVALMFGFAAIGRAGTPQENFYMGQANLSGTTILASTASTTSSGNFTLTIATPTVLYSGGGAYQGRNCFTKFVVQVPTTTVVTIADGDTTKWTLYGVGFGASGVNTKDLIEDHLGPLCHSVRKKTFFTLTNAHGISTNPASINVEGYTTYGGTLNAGPLQ